MFKQFIAQPYMAYIRVRRTETRKLNLTKQGYVDCEISTRIRSFYV